MAQIEVLFTPETLARSLAARAELDIETPEGFRGPVFEDATLEITPISFCVKLHKQADEYHFPAHTVARVRVRD